MAGYARSSAQCGDGFSTSNTCCSRLLGVLGVARCSVFLSACLPVAVLCVKGSDNRHSYLTPTSIPRSLRDPRIEVRRCSPRPQSKLRPTNCGVCREAFCNGDVSVIQPTTASQCVPAASTQPYSSLLAGMGLKKRYDDFANGIEMTRAAKTSARAARLASLHNSNPLQEGQAGNCRRAPASDADLRAADGMIGSFHMMLDGYFRPTWADLSWS